MYGHMFNFGFGNNIYYMLAFGLTRVLLIMGVIFLIVKLVKNNRQGHNVYQYSNRDMEILKEKYAKGEINEEEFEHKMKKLNE